MVRVVEQHKLGARRGLLESLGVGDADLHVAFAL
jgi:hypothetical protein